MRVYCWQRRMGQANWVFPSANATRWPEQTNRILISFAYIGERTYNITRRELLPGIWEVLVLQLYKEGILFTVRFNHNAFKWISNLADLAGNFVGWRLFCPGASSKSSTTLYLNTKQLMHYSSWRWLDLIKTWSTTILRYCAWPPRSLRQRKKMGKS